MRSPVLFLSLLASLAAPPLPAQQPDLPLPPAPAVAARAYVLVDFNSGQTLASGNPQERMDPASLTKLMTAYVTFTALRQKRIGLEQAAPVTDAAWRAEGSRMFIQPHKPVTVGELVRGMIIQSANDASIALAELIAGSEEVFVRTMNGEAQRLGLANTHFANATGLPAAQHYSTAQDLALLAAAVIRDFPEHYPLYSQKEYRYNDVAQPNRNRLLWSDPSVDGMKTGYTERAGYCLIASAKRGERRLLSVVLGAASESARAAESQKLLNHGFLAYEGVRLYAGKQAVTTLPVFKGAANKVQAGFLADMNLALPRGSSDRLKASIESLQPLLAPIEIGQAVGTMKLTLGGKPYRDVPVVALEAVPAAGILGRGWDTLRLMFR